MSKYGFCPHCGAEVATRERRLDGNDTCAAGHVYPSAFTLTSTLARDWVGMVRDTLFTLYVRLDEHAVTTTAFTRREAREYALRCQRTLEAIPGGGPVEPRSELARGG